MKRWERATRNRLCGCCGQPIAKGDPVLVLTIQTIEKVRCVGCDGPAPADLPVDGRRFRLVPREPGEDDAA